MRFSIIQKLQGNHIRQKLSNIIDKKNSDYALLIPILIASAFLIAICIHDGHNWSGDDALYIEQARALIDGSIDKLYELNKYSTDHAFRIQGPYLYPMGFPIMLS